MMKRERKLSGEGAESNEDRGRREAVGVCPVL